MARSITIEDLYHIKFVSRPRISPDGQRVAFVVTRIDERKHEYRSAIWLSPADGGEARVFTAESKATSSPSWSPDGRWLAFVSDREGTATGKDEKARKEQGEPLPKVRVIDRLWYRLDGVGFIYERRSHLFLLDIAGGEPQQLTDGDWDDRDAAWSPDGTQIAFASNHAEDRWRLPGADIYTLSLKDGQAGALRCLTDGSLDSAAPSWSPDGKTIAFLASPKLHSAGQVYLYTIASDAEQAPATCISKEFEGTCMDWTNSDIGDEHLMPAPAWSSDGETLYLLASQRGATRLYAIPRSGADPRPATLTPGDVHVRDFSIDDAKDRLALLVATATRPQEIFVRSTAPSDEMRRITGFNDTLFNELQLAAPEYMSYTGVDGWPMDGW